MIDFALQVIITLPYVIHTTIGIPFISFNLFNTTKVTESKTDYLYKQRFKMYVRLFYGLRCTNLVGVCTNFIAIGEAVLHTCQ